MHILYWFENTKEHMSENQYLSLYIDYHLKQVDLQKEGKIWPTQSRPILVQFNNFHKEYLQQIAHKRDLNNLHSYKNIFGQLVYHKQ